MRSLMDHKMLSMRTKKFKASIIWLKDASLTIRKNKHKHLIKENQEEKKEQF